MPYTKDRKDLEVEVIQRCVKAIKLEGRSKNGRYIQMIDTAAISRVLAYLKQRFNAA